MSELHTVEYFVVRYVPNAVKGEFVNIGAIVFKDGPDGKRQAAVRFTNDWRRVRSLDPSIDVELFTAMQEELQDWLNSDVPDCSRGGVLLPRREWILQMLQDCASNAIQVSDGHAFGAPEAGHFNLDRVARDLLREYCGVEAPAVERELAGRTFIRKRMREEFQRTGVWNLMSKGIPVSEFTREGDLLKIDCGYEVKRREPGELLGLLPGTQRVDRLFHAVSLTNSVDASTVLAYAWPSLRDGYQKRQQSTAILTAIIDDDLDQEEETVGSAIEFLGKKGVVVSYLKHLPEIADRARRETQA